MSSLLAGGTAGVAQRNSIITDLAFSSQSQRLFVTAKGVLLQYDVRHQVICSV
jgi:hypothetical protein